MQGSSGCLKNANYIVYLFEKVCEAVVVSVGLQDFVPPAQADCLNLTALCCLRLAVPQA